MMVINNFTFSQTVTTQRDELPLVKIQRYEKNKLANKEKCTKH